MVITPISRVKSPQANPFIFAHSEELLYNPQSSILIGFSIMNHPFWGFHYPILGNTPIKKKLHDALRTNRTFLDDSQNLIQVGDPVINGVK